MKTLLIVTVLVASSLATAQAPDPKLTRFESIASFQQNGFLEQRNTQEKRKILDLGESNKSEDKMSIIEVRRNASKAKIIDFFRDLLQQSRLTT